MFDAKQFCSDYQIDYAKSGKYHRRGWTNVICPFCGGSSRKLGINHKNGYGTCYGCGFHSLQSSVAKLALVNFYLANEIIIKYSTGDIKDDAQIKRPTEIKFPPGTGVMKPHHFNYLKSRNFKPSLARMYGLLGTGIHGDYSHRIIIPINDLDGRMVSYQGRDITGRSELKYKACAKDNEIIPHQQMIYSGDLVRKDRTIIVEGVMDAWRFQKNAIATFGINWTSQQARMIANKYKNFVILFDPEEQAQIQAQKLYNYLTGRGLEGEIVLLNTGCDPGDLSDKQANEILGDLNFL